MSDPSPFYGRFTAEIAIMARCSEGHSSNEVFFCSRHGCDGQVCERHSTVCSQCSRTYCSNRHLDEFDANGRCEICSE
jgi:hypothetical protein